MEHNARKDNHIAGAQSRMHKYPAVFTTEDELIPYSVNSTTIRPLQEITSNHINLSDSSTTSSPTSNYASYNMPSCGAINFNHVDCDFNKCRGRAEIAGHYHSCPNLDEEDMEVTSKNAYELIKK